MKFNSWFKELNQLVWDEMGISIKKLDVDYRAGYDEGFSPGEFYRNFIAQNSTGYYDFFEGW